MNPIAKYWLILLLFFILITGCENTQSINKMIEEKGINHVLHIEKISNDLFIVFDLRKSDKNNTMLGYYVFKKNVNSWVTLDSGASPISNSTNPIVYDSLTINSINQGLIYGFINTPEINNVVINGDHIAKILQKDNYRIWFSILNPKELNVPGLKIQAVDFMNKIIYQEP